MNRTIEIDKLQSALLGNRILLSAAFLETSKAALSASPGLHQWWLNREITGYDRDDFGRLPDLRLQSLCESRKIKGTVVLRWPNGAQHEKGVGSTYLHDSILELENKLNEVFDVSVFEHGSISAIDSAISPVVSVPILLPLSTDPISAFLAVPTLELLKLYVRLKELLCDCMRTIHKEISGQDLLRI